MALESLKFRLKTDSIGRIRYIDKIHFQKYWEIHKHSGLYRIDCNMSSAYLLDVFLDMAEHDIEIMFATRLAVDPDNIFGAAGPQHQP